LSASSNTRSPACLNPLSAPPEARRILVIRLGAFGDVARTLPAVAALRGAYPRSQLVWLVEPGSAEVAALSPAVDEVLVFPRSRIVAALRAGRLGRAGSEIRAFVRLLRAGAFDLVIDFHGLLKSGVIGRLSGAPVRVGYAPPFAREASWLAATHRAQLGAGTRSRHARNAGLVGFVAGRAGADRALGPDTTDSVRVSAGAREQLLEAFEGEAPGVVLHPGTSAGTPYKRWRPERFAILAGRIREATGSPCVVTCGPDPAEQALARAVVDAAGGAARVAPGDGSVALLAALLEQAPALIAADSGPLHLAAVLGTPVVQLLGPTDPVENAPHPGAPARVLRVPMRCSPCRRGCRNPVCMDAIPVASVASAVAELLAEGPSAAGCPPWRAA